MERKGGFIMEKKLNIMVIGAHPDDCDGGCGGIALKYRKLGHAVQFISTTDGSAGHQSCDRSTLAKIRRAEAQLAGEKGDIFYQVMNDQDGRLEGNLKSRETILRVIRKFEPDIIFTHRLNDYHPDHRYTSQLVQDSSYLVMIPNVCPDTPPMKFQPIICFIKDGFKRPYPFSADIAVRIDDVIDRKLEMVSCHKSQYADFLPYMDHLQNLLPQDYDDSKYAFDCVNTSDAKTANEYREQLIARYGEKTGLAAKYAEVYEISEYGRQINKEEINDYFPL